MQKETIKPESLVDNQETLAFTHDDVKRGDELVETHTVDKSPLKVVGNKERGYALVLGKNRISEWHKTPNEVFVEMGSTAHWDTICKVAAQIALDIVAELIPIDLNNRLEALENLDK